MSDDLTVSGAGSIRVYPEQLSNHAARLNALSSTLASFRAQLATVDGAHNSFHLVGANVPVSALTAELHMTAAAHAMFAASAKCELLAQAVEAAALAYGVAEDANRARMTTLAGLMAYQLGAALPALAIASLPASISLGALYALTPEERREHVLGWLASNAPSLKDPRVVLAVRLIATSADDFAMGAARVPPELSMLLGNETLGILGVTTSAGVITIAGRPFGILRETPVAVRRTESRMNVAPVATIEQMADRIPTAREQIRIELYTMPGGEERAIVYLQGTRDPSLLASVEPFDMTSNLELMRLGDAGSQRAVDLALSEAGVGAETPVMIVGHSQSAAIAANIAREGEHNVQGLLTLGGPQGSIPVPEDIPYLAVEHDEDMIPALGGYARSDEPVFVRRSLYSGAPPSDTPPLAAHSLDRYVETAALIDRSDDERLSGVREELLGFTAGAEKVETSKWHAERVPEEAPEASGASCR